MHRATERGMSAARLTRRSFLFRNPCSPYSMPTASMNPANKPQGATRSMSSTAQSKKPVSCEERDLEPPSRSHTHCSPHLSSGGTKPDTFSGKGLSDRQPTQDTLGQDQGQENTQSHLFLLGQKYRETSRIPQSDFHLPLTCTRTHTHACTHTQAHRTSIRGTHLFTFF